MATVLALTAIAVAGCGSASSDQTTAADAVDTAGTSQLADFCVGYAKAKVFYGEGTMTLSIEKEVADSPEWQHVSKTTGVSTDDLAAELISRCK